MDTLQKIKELYKQAQELKRLREETDSKVEDKKLKNQIYDIETEIENLACDLVEGLIPETISISIKVEKKIEINPDYYDFDSMAYDIASNPSIYQNKAAIRKSMLERFRDNIDGYDFIESEDIKIEYD